MHAESGFPSSLRIKQDSLTVALHRAVRRVARSRAFALTKELFSPHSRAGQIVFDAVIFAFCVPAAYLIRFDGELPGPAVRHLMLWLPLLALTRLMVNAVEGVYRLIWRFVCLRDAIAIARSLFLPTALLLAVRAFYPDQAPLADWVRVPLSIIALEFLLALSATLGARATCRVLDERSRRVRLGPGRRSKRIVLYGAGRAGVLLSRDLASHADIKIVGFVDDRLRKVGTVISGHRVLGTGDALELIVKRYRIDEVVISIATGSAASLTRILNRCRQVPVAAKIIPSIQELLSREARISNLREVRIEDLLGREAVPMGGFDDEVRQAYKGKRILVTGAGGSIGSELTRQLLFLEPAKIVILDKDENSIYDLEQELKFRNPQVAIEPVIADVKLRERLSAVFAGCKPEVVFHAAAHKHVPLMERHPCEAILNNVMGTMNVLETCVAYGTERFIFISSDKAVNPTNVMGATKSVGEKLVSSYALDGRLQAACVRFGNVMGSRGSVIPLFRKQIEKGGPVTVTHPDILRYFMTIPEAVQLVICAGSLAHHGELFVLDMGSPRRVLDLARQMIQLSGLEPGKDIPITITGLRPGEKMNEELVAPGETLSTTRFEKISVIQNVPYNEQELGTAVTGLIMAAQHNERQVVYELLSSMGLGFTPHPGPVLVPTPGHSDSLMAA